MRSFALTSKGQVTVPVTVRRKLKLNGNARILFKEEGDRVYVERAQDDITSIFGMFKAKKGVSIERMAQAPALAAVARFERATARRK